MAEYAFKDVITAKDIMTQEISVIDLLGRERKGWFLNSMPEYIDANTLHRLHSPRRLVDVNPFSMTPFKDDRGDCYCLFISEKESEKVRPFSFLPERYAERPSAMKVSDWKSFISSPPAEEPGSGLQENNSAIIVRAVSILIVFLIYRSV